MIRVSLKKLLLLSAAVSFVLVMFFFIRGDGSDQEEEESKAGSSEEVRNSSWRLAAQNYSFLARPKQHRCPAAVTRSGVDMDTGEILPTLNFQADWIEKREYWNEKMQKRYENRRRDAWKKVPLKVILMPHSHNDPGWLKTYEGYFNTQTRTILDNAVDKLTKYKNLTFVWTEVSYLSLWYSEAHDSRKANFHQLVEEGRLEVLTGGWVMTDEANVEVFGMLHQLTEGHQWLRTHLNLTPKASWSCDPFGHGATLPYLLKSSGLDSMVIMRIHYAWKEWFAREQQGDFMWRQSWDPAGDHDILTHNFPYDIYSIKHSCGPHPQTCLEFNFKKVSGDFSEYSARYTPVHAGNVKERAETLLAQYGKTGSLFPHNVVLVPLGDDFAYFNEVEWDQQYANYKLLVDHINQGKYHAEVRFGTLSDYFAEVRKRMSNFDTLAGDFHVYSDIFSEGRPAYWSGYYSTRPFMKKLSRELDGHLRAAEILYTFSLNRARQSREKSAANALTGLYRLLAEARQNLALFQHHDAITGTSKQAVMHDYGLKLYDGILNCRKLEKSTLQYLTSLRPRSDFNSFSLAEDVDRPSYSAPPSPVAMDLRGQADSFVMLFNPLAQDQQEVVSIFLETADVCVTDPAGLAVEHQINPTWNASGFFRLDTSFVELTFVARLPALSVSRFTVARCQAARTEQTEVICLRCPKLDKSDSPFHLSPMPEGSVQIENSELVLVFDVSSRLLATATNKRSGRVHRADLEFAGYPTAQFRSGAYLFKTDDRMAENVDVFNQGDLKEVVVISGVVFSEVTLVFESGASRAEPSSFVHTVRLYHTKDGIRNKGVYIENNFNFNAPENHNDVDLFMRFRSSVKNGNDSPEFYTDANGFQMLKRKVVRQINVEGNLYPLTTMAYVEDEETRMTLVVDHAHGSTSWQEGWLEVVVDRRATFDDSRGMGEGVLDNRETSHRYWLLFEERGGKQRDSTHQSLPSQLANRLSRTLNNPPLQYVGKDPDAFRPQTKLLAAPLPCDLHLLNLRTLSDMSHPDAPSREALLVLHRQSSDCDLNYLSRCQGEAFKLGEGLKVKKIRRTTLTGVKSGVEAKSVEEVAVAPMTMEALVLTF